MREIRETEYLSALLDLRISVESVTSDKVFVLSYREWEVGYKISRGDLVDVRKIYLKLNSDKYEIADVSDEDRDGILRPLYDTFIHPFGGNTELVGLDSRTLLIKQAVPKGVPGGVVLN